MTDVALMTYPNVELLEVGEDWETSTGVFTWTLEDLQAAIESQSDPSIRTPILKLGHSDPRFDGQPSFGRVENLRLSENQQTLIGDYVGVPVWLGQILPSAYPRRSIEGEFNYTSKTGNTWSFILSAVSLLGAFYPAISTLEDLKEYWGVEAPELVPVADVPEVLGSVGEVEMAPVEASMPQMVRAAVSVEDIRRSFYETLGPGQYWWWIREIRVNPPELIVDDDEGSLWRVSYVLDGDTITFGEAQEVKVEYVNVAATAPVVPVTQGQKVAASWKGPEAAGRPKRDASGRRAAASGTVPETQEVPSVKLSDDALRKLGLEPGATEEQINEAIMAKVQEQQASDPSTGEPASDPGGAKPEGDPEPTPAPATDPGTTQPETAPGVEDKTPKVPDGMVLIDTATLDQLKQGAVAAQSLVKQQRDAHKRSVLAAAVQAGKFPKSRMQHYSDAWDADAKGTEDLIGRLAEGLVPVQERGVETKDDVQAGATYPDSWKPAVTASRRGVNSKIKVVAD